MDATGHRPTGDVGAPAELSGAGLPELAELRARAYLLLGLLFHPPGAARLEELSLLAGELRGERELARELAFHPPFAALLDAVCALTEGRLEALRGEYVELFQRSTGRAPCALYESAYVDRGGRLTGWVLSSVEGAYRAAGLELSELAGGELPDHAGLELEFMSLLCAREAEARRAADAGAVAGALASQRSFLRAHVGRWLPEAARRLRRRAVPDGIYARLADAAHAFVIHDRGLVGARSGAGVLSQGLPPLPER